DAAVPFRRVGNLEDRLGKALAVEPRLDRRVAKMSLRTKGPHGQANGSALNGRPGARPSFDQQGPFARPVRSSAWLSRYSGAAGIVISHVQSYGIGSGPSFRRQYSRQFSHHLAFAVSMSVGNKRPFKL